jgi:hypothetical protein
MASYDFDSGWSCVIVFFGKIIPNEALKKPTLMGGLPRKTEKVLATAAEKTGKTKESKKSSGWFRH